MHTHIEMYFQAIEAAKRKIKEADKMQSKASSISSSMDFLTRIYIGSKDGDSYGINVSKWLWTNLASRPGIHASMVYASNRGLCDLALMGVVN